MATNTFCQEPPCLLQDLKINIQKVCLVFPCQETERKSMFLSNIDKMLNFPVKRVQFFQSHKDFPPQVVAEKLKNALAKILVPYDFLAGRLRSNPETGRLEVDCNSAGIGFVVASSDYTLESVGDLVYPNPAFGQLICKNMDNLEPDDQPLCIVQVTSLTCGGFAIGFSTNHVIFDGSSFKIFLDNLGALVADKSLVITPCNDRQLLAARSPPQVTFPHLELAKLDDLVNHSVFDATSEASDFKVFRLTSENVTDLKEKAKGSGGHAHITGFNVVTALIWRCKVLSRDDEETNGGNNLDRVSTLLYAVNIRHKLFPPLPISYTGNAVLTGYARAKRMEIEEVPFPRLVEMVSEGAKRMTHEYARSVIDWGEIYQGIANGDLLVSSWLKLGLNEVDYPWGRPLYTCPVGLLRKGIILLLPDMDDEGNGVNILVSLSSKEMSTFQSLFREYLANS